MNVDAICLREHLALMRRYSETWRDFRKSECPQVRDLAAVALREAIRQRRFVAYYRREIAVAAKIEAQSTQESQRPAPPLVVDPLLCAANAWRKRRGFLGKGGYVLTRGGTPSGWFAELEEPQKRALGSIAIDEDGRRWEVVGGNHMGVASSWRGMDSQVTVAVGGNRR